VWPRAIGLVVGWCHNIGCTTSGALPVSKLGVQAGCTQLGHLVATCLIGLLTARISEAYDDLVMNQVMLHCRSYALRAFLLCSAAAAAGSSLLQCVLQPHPGMVTYPPSFKVSH